MNKTRSARRMHKMLIAVAALTLVLGVAIGGTVAYLVAQTGEVTNTFTVGNITIDLKESQATDNKIAAGAALDRTKNNYKIIPGDTVDKNPTVIVNKGSETCYVFVKVVNNLLVDNASVATLNIDSTKWTEVGTVTNGKVYVYSANGKEAVVNALPAEQKLLVFDKVTIANTVSEDKIGQLADQTITVDAYAHQSENVEYSAALASALIHFGATAITSGT